MKSKNNYSFIAQKKNHWPYFVGAAILAICLHLCATPQALAEKMVDENKVAEKAFVENVVRNKPYSRIVVSAFVKGAFTREIVESIKSGAPVTFTYFVQLERKRAVLWDETVRKIAIKRMVKLDTLRKEYIAWEKFDEDEDDIEFEAELAAMAYKNANIIGEAPKAGKSAKKKPPVKQTALEPDRFKDIEQLNQWMTHLDKIDLGPIDGLKDKKPYYARVKCEMKTIKLAPPFNYILFFVALWNFDTDWGKSEPFNLNGDTLEKVKMEKKSALLN